MQQRLHITGSRARGPLLGLVWIFLQAMLGAAPAPLIVTTWLDPIVLPVKPGGDLRFRSISTRGLSQTRVAQIQQDDRGFLWFGTQYGLNRYDGYESRVFVRDHSDPKSLSAVYISALHKDPSGRLWVGAVGGIDRYDEAAETFVHYAISPTGRNPAVTVNDISTGRDGRLWVATNDGLRGLNITTGNWVRYGPSADDTASLGNSDIRASGVDRTGRMWVAHSTGLDAFDPATGKVDMRVPLPNSGHGLLFLEDRHGDFWVIGGGESKLIRFDREGGTLTSLQPATRPGARFTAILEDREGRLWLGTQADGLFCLDDARREFRHYEPVPGDPNSLADQRVTALHEDHEGNIWIAFHQVRPQVVTPRPAAFVNVARRLGEAPDKGLGLVSVLHLDPRGDLWVGTPRRLRVLERATGHVRDFTLTQGVDVLAIANESADVVWIGTAGDGLLRHNLATGETLKFKSDPRDPNSIGSSQIQALLVQADGTVWAATWNGLSKFDPRTQHFTTYKPEQSTRGLNYYALCEDANGILWVGSNLGLHRFDPATAQFSVFRADANTPGTLSDNRVNAVLIDHAGVLWAGTQNGLARFDPAQGGFTTFSSRDGLVGNVVSAIVEDGANALWLATNRGIARLDANRTVFTTYDETDGLPGPDLTGWGAFEKGATGEILFGGFSGAVSFFPGQVDDACLPRLTLTNFRLFDSSSPPRLHEQRLAPITTASNLRLEHWQNFLSFEFSALSYVNPDGVRYRYQLDGLDAQWVTVGSDERHASYTALQPGRYTLRIEAATARGAWITPGVRLPIEILPPWWDTAEFRVGCALLIALLLFAVYRTRIEGIKRRQREFRRLADNAPDLVMRFDQHLRLVFINPRIRDYTTQPVATLLGRTCAEIATAGPALPVDAAALPAVLSSGIHTLREFEQATAQGNRHFESRLIAERDDRGQTKSVLAITRDFTDRKQTEASLKASETRLADTRSALAHVSRVTTMGQLAASIAHEVSQPVAGILANAKAGVRWLAATPPNLDEAGLAFQRIARDGERTGAVVHRLRALFQRTGHLRQPVDINGAIRETSSLVENESRKRGVTLSLALAADTGEVLGDRIELQQVVLNLIVNGLDAMLEAAPPRTLRISAHREGRRVWVSVQDEGPGLSDQVRASLFTPFFTTKPHGLGMGLVICRSIIEAHGGELTAASTGSGATFQFWLPADVTTGVPVV